MVFGGSLTTGRVRYVAFCIENCLKLISISMIFLNLYFEQCRPHLGGGWGGASYHLVFDILFDTAGGRPQCR